MNRKQKVISKKIDRICVIICVAAALITAVLDSKERRKSGTETALHGGRTVI